MKRPSLFRQLSVAALASLIAASFASCDQFTSGAGTDAELSDSLDSLGAMTDTVFAVRHFTFSDSLYDEETGRTSTFHVEIDLPTGGNKTLIDNIGRWVMTYISPTAQVDALLDTSDEAMKGIAQEFYNQDDFWAGSSFDEKFLMVFEDSCYVSYEMEGEVFLGGIHGMPYHVGMTFDKRTGEQFSAVMLTETDGLMEVIRDSLTSYFKSCGDEDADEMLFDNVRDSLPLPTCPAWMVEEGVKFVYGAYEIAPYAAGMPSFVIPYETMKKYMDYEVKPIAKAQEPDSVVNAQQSKTKK